VAAARHLRNLCLLAGKSIAPLSSLLARFISPARVAPAAWNRMYSEGSWDYLIDLEELGRYSIIAGYVATLRPRGAILDIGCGEGILQQRLAPNYERYVGIDVATEAIQRAQRRADRATSFQAVDALAFDTDQSFDIIIFNESLYYFEQPLAVVDKYNKLLRENGRFVLSMSVFIKSLRVWRAIEDALTVEDEVVVIHRRGPAWVVQLLAPRGGQHSLPDRRI
jgi:2-polyprenyl-3-methyl-5-hydroxy-6-metoxy-1,4-benzoquinol methylase